jgi:hypothetical protein
MLGNSKQPWVDKSDKKMSIDQSLKDTGLYSKESHRHSEAYQMSAILRLFANDMIPVIWDEIE